jgi:hypothetical protein
MNNWRIRFDVSDPSKWDALSNALNDPEDEAFREDLSLLGSGYSKPEVEVGEVVFTARPSTARIQEIQDVIERHLGVQGTVVRGPDSQPHQVS